MPPIPKSQKTQVEKRYLGHAAKDGAAAAFPAASGTIVVTHGVPEHVSMPDDRPNGGGQGYYAQCKADGTKQDIPFTSRFV
jgi:hypothetical protein